ncbi:MAG: hypothetical protein O7G85_13015 [Planctomycetota bacterium]|nr:hypothetical protein [Planctomycetota bacterium]
MRSQLTIASLSLALALTWGVDSVQAQPTVVFVGNNATGIQDLQIGSEYFNVEFVFDFGPDAYGSPGAFYFIFQTQAAIANLAVNAALSTEPAVETVGGNNSSTYRIPFELESGNYTVQWSRYKTLLGIWLQFETPDLVSIFDPETFAVFTVTCPEDSDDDGNVEVDDLLDLLADWGTCGPPCPTDIVKNGEVDVDDLLALLAAWGPC